MFAPPAAANCSPGRGFAAAFDNNNQPRCVNDRKEFSQQLNWAPEWNHAPRARSLWLGAFIIGQPLPRMHCIANRETTNIIGYSRRKRKTFANRCQYFKWNVGLMHLSSYTLLWGVRKVWGQQHQGHAGTNTNVGPTPKVLNYSLISWVEFKGLKYCLVANTTLISGSHPTLGLQHPEHESWGFFI